MTNKLADILNSQRSCVRGHGTMLKQPGIWVLQQVQRSGGGLLGGEPNLRTTGQLLTTEVYTCPTCGFVELVNEGDA